MKVQLNIATFKKQLRPGSVYRRADMAVITAGVDTSIRQLVKAGLLQKIVPSMYYCPKKTTFGIAPPDDKVLIKSFLNGGSFLLISPNTYNSLGVGTTQLYNSLMVYNEQRSGKVSIGTRIFDFKRKLFPKKIYPEFLLVDLVNNLSMLAEDHEKILKHIPGRIKSMDKKKLSNAVSAYGTKRTIKIFSKWT